jgi:hypothetical protein
MSFGTTTTGPMSSDSTKGDMTWRFLSGRVGYTCLSRIGDRIQFALVSHDSGHRGLRDSDPGQPGESDGRRIALERGCRHLRPARDDRQASTPYTGTNVALPMVCCSI